MASGVQNAAQLVFTVWDGPAVGGGNALHIDAQLLLQDVYLLVERQLPATENPRTAEGGTAYHDAIDAVLAEGTVGIVQRPDVAVADDGNVDAGIALHVTDECPVGLAGVHLATGAPVDGQCLDATVLQLFGQLGDDELLVVPAQTGLGRHRQTDGIYDLTGNLQHLRDVLQHTGTGTLTSHLLHGTAEVEVDEVRPCLLDYLGSFYHGIYVTTVKLDAHRSLLVADGQLLHCRLDIPDQSLGRHKLGVHHGSSEPLAQHTEADVRHVLHRGQKDRALAQFYSSYLHSGCKVTNKGAENQILGCRFFVNVCG